MNDNTENQNLTLHVPSNVLRALTGAHGKRDIRPYLNGIYLDPEGALVATNGHVMAVYSLPEYQAAAVKAWDPKNYIFTLTKRPPATDETVSLTLYPLSGLIGRGCGIAQWGHSGYAAAEVVDTKGKEYADWRLVDAWQTSGDWKPGMGAGGDHGVDVTLLHAIHVGGWRFWERDEFPGKFRAVPTRSSSTKFYPVGLSVTVMGVRV